MSVQSLINAADNFNVLYRNVLRDAIYQAQYRIDYPVDRSYDDSGYYIEYALVDAKLADIKITTTNDELFVTYHPSKDDERSNRQYLERRIVNRGFDHAFRITAKLDLGNLSSTYQNGLLQIKIPWAQSALPKEVTVIDLNKQLPA